MTSTNDVSKRIKSTWFGDVTAVEAAPWIVQATPTDDTLTLLVQNVAGTTALSIDGHGNVLTAGDFLANSTTNSMIANQHNGIFSGDHQTISGTSQRSAILSGNLNTISGASIGNVIAGGVSSSISGGTGNTMSGGTGNTMATFNDQTIGGGNANAVSNTNATIGGGVSNVGSGISSFIGGGDSNQALGAWDTVAGGHLNIAGASKAFIGGGESNQVSGVYSSVVGGTLNQATGQWALASGNTCIASGQGAIALGTQNTASGSGSVALGSAVNAPNYGELAFGGSPFASLGDNQNSFYTLSNESNATGTITLYLDYPTNSKEIILGANGVNCMFALSTVSQAPTNNFHTWEIIYANTAGTGTFGGNFTGSVGITNNTYPTYSVVTVGPTTYLRVQQYTLTATLCKIKVVIFNAGMLR